jgi:hypothetical protein
MSTFADIYKEVSFYLGLGLSPAGDDLTRVKAYANAGYKRFLLGLHPQKGFVHEWTFLSPYATLNIWADVTAEAESIAHDAGTSTITTADDTFYDTMVGKTVQFETNSYTITAYTSATVIEVSGDASGETGEFTIASDNEFALPTDYARLIEPFTYPPANALLRIDETTSFDIKQLYSAGQTSGTPCLFATYTIAYVAATGQRYGVMFWPTPNVDVALNYRYRVNPTAMTNDADIPMGGPIHYETILEAALAKAESSSDDRIGVHDQRFKELMIASIGFDASTRPSNVGALSEGEENIYVERRQTVTYE